MKYQHLTIEEREKIQLGLWAKKSIRTIAKEIGRPPSAVSREMKRNISTTTNKYNPRVSHERALVKRTYRGRTLHLKSGFIRRYAVAGLKKGLSPEQISGRLTLEYPQEKISHEAIYQYIYSQVHRDGYGLMRPGYHDLRPYLKRRHKRRGHHGMRSVQRVFRPKGPSIDDRPLEVTLRQTIGHWETDSVVSKKSKVGLNTLVERKTGLVFISKIENSKAETTKNTVVRRLRTLPALFRQTVTSDNGHENFLFDEAEKDLGFLLTRITHGREVRMRIPMDSFGGTFQKVRILPQLMTNRFKSWKTH